MASRRWFLSFGGLIGVVSSLARASGFAHGRAGSGEGLALGPPDQGGPAFPESAIVGGERQLARRSGSAVLLDFAEDYTNLLSFDGAATHVQVLAAAHAGVFVRTGGAPLASDGGTRFPHASGVGNWVRQFNGGVELSWFGAIGDGSSNTVGERFGSVGGASALYPFARYLDDELDDCAFKAALDYAKRNRCCINVRSGTYLHRGIELHHSARLKGEGSGLVRLLNISGANSIEIPELDPPWLSHWELSGLTLDAKKIAGSKSAGISLNTVRHGLIQDVEVLNHFFGWIEQSSWDVEWRGVRLVNNEYMGRIRSGVSTGGVPSYRYGIYGSRNRFGIDIEERGISSTVFVGGAIERSQEWAARIVGNASRTIGFIGFNFEDNSRSGGPDFIIGDVNSGPSNIYFEGCQFTRTKEAALISAFDLYRGGPISVRNCNFINYFAVAKISSQFGNFIAEGLGGNVRWLTDQGLDYVVKSGVTHLIANSSGGVSISAKGMLENFTWKAPQKNRRGAEISDVKSGSVFSVGNDGRLSWFDTDNREAAFISRSVAEGLDVVRCNTIFAAMAGLGVGNSTLATEKIEKAADRKIEIFDQAGKSLGFIAVYKTIN